MSAIISRFIQSETGIAVFAADPATSAFGKAGKSHGMKCCSRLKRNGSAGYSVNHCRNSWDTVCLDVKGYTC